MFVDMQVWALAPDTGTACPQTLTPLQQAQLEVACFPQLPDALTVCGIVANQQADPGSQTAAAAQQDQDSSKRFAKAAFKRTQSGSLRAVSA